MRQIVDLHKKEGRLCLLLWGVSGRLPHSPGELRGQLRVRRHRKRKLNHDICIQYRKGAR